MKTRHPLPSWAAQHDTRDDTIVADPDLFYPAILGEIEAAGVPDNFPPLDVRKPGRYWREVAYQFAKMDLQIAVGGYGFTIHIRGDGARKEKWANKNAPNVCARLKREDLLDRHKHLTPSTINPDEYRATYKHEARAHYERVRGYLPK